MAFAVCPPEDSPLLGGTPAEPGKDQEPSEAVEQAQVTRRYDRMARFYDIYDAPMEWMGTRKRRRRVVSAASGRALEVGIGTGKNLPHYPAGVDLTGLDVSAAMLSKARRRADRLESAVTLEHGDVTSLPYRDDSFDTTVATSVFCSVADPVAGLAELGRVTKPDGRILLLEHVRPRNRILGWMADLATAFTRRVFGFRANRRTEDNLVAAGLDVVDIRREGIWREVIARPPAPDTETEGNSQ
jgi:ubiquinone/menaquinone biosynthesis C-methylase UbiE